MYGKNGLERLGTRSHPMITLVDHHLLVAELKHERVYLNINKAFPTLNNKEFV